MENKVFLVVLYIVFILIFWKVLSFNLDIELVVIYGGLDYSGLFGYIVVIYFYNG